MLAEIGLDVFGSILNQLDYYTIKNLNITNRELNFIISNDKFKSLIYYKKYIYTKGKLITFIPEMFRKPFEDNVDNIEIKCTNNQNNQIKIEIIFKERLNDLPIDQNNNCYATLTKQSKTFDIQQFKDFYQDNDLTEFILQASYPELNLPIFGLPPVSSFFK